MLQQKASYQVEIIVYYLAMGQNGLENPTARQISTTISSDDHLSYGIYNNDKTQPICVYTITSLSDM